MIRRMPAEPAPTRWALPQVTSTVGEVAGVGADLAPGTLLAAYRAGLFPMRLHAGGPIGWWSPDPRGVIPLDDLHVSRSLRRAARA
jgi:leucyl/phenylalanyl-tRNA--protein transferase